MQRLFVLLLLLAGCFISKAQKISVEHLESLLRKRNTLEVSQYLSDFDWEYIGSEAGSSDYEETDTWYQAGNEFTNYLQAKLVLYTYLDTLEMMLCAFYDQETLISFVNEIDYLGYEKYNQDTLNGVEINFYKGRDFYIKLRNGMNQPDEDGDHLHILGIIRRRGYYDPNFGAKKEYFEDGTLWKSYFLVDGKLNGRMEVYSEFGKLESIDHYKHNNKTGKSTYYYYGDNGKGSLIAKLIGDYINDQKEGIWKFIYLGDDEYRTLYFNTYSNGKKNGLFQKAEGDSLILGSYKSGNLHGEYQIYFDRNKFHLGGIINTDTTQLELLTKGNFSEGRRSGYWWVNDFSSISVGQYFNGKKTGEWNYYYLEEKSDVGEELPFSNKLFLTENYTNGRLNGDRKQYWKEVKIYYPCSEEEWLLAELEMCYNSSIERMLEISSYKGGKLHGYYELKDDKENILLKGYYLNGVKDGGWLEVDYLDSSRFFHRIESKGFYDRGLKTGEWTEQETIRVDDDNGVTITCNGQYINNEKNGIWECYDLQGSHVQTLSYKEDLLDGECTLWYDEGIPMEISLFTTGELREYMKYKPENSDQPFEKYSISEKEISNLTYVKVTNSDGGYTIQEHLLNKADMSIYTEDLEDTFVIFVDNPWQNGEGTKHGVYELYDNADNLLESGKYFMGDKVDYWVTYFHHQKIRVEVEYKFDKPLKETYYDIESEKPYSGTFTYTDQEANTRESRSIKKGVRDGKTKIYNLKTEKLIKKEDYKEGVLQ
jgi:antitoxin component YwqK of YwqJK toxin-antitoxin module